MCLQQFQGHSNIQIIHKYVGKSWNKNRSMRSLFFWVFSLLPRIVWNCLFWSISSITITTHWGDILTSRPVCQTASYAAVKTHSPLLLKTTFYVGGKSKNLITNTLIGTEACLITTQRCSQSWVLTPYFIQSQSAFKTDISWYYKLVFSPSPEALHWHFSS